MIGDPKDPTKPIPHPVVWKSTIKNLNIRTTTSKITYEAAYNYPLSGWMGFFVEFSFNGLENSVLTVTSETNVIPDTFPFEDCYGESCKGTLV